MTLQLKESSDQLSFHESLAGQSMPDFRISAAPKHYPSAPIEGQELTVLRLRGGCGTENSDDGKCSNSASSDSWSDLICTNTKPFVRGN